MENPEEVLQALDEFQKLRPSEIPKELEEYLCWVAKTGDPVYQWSLIKALFREKLLRVMTDFYESCPSLELAPCPNVKQFNYERMKCNLLDRLETFANAPFTVQRICELLTAPRKEYNRVDKFMRAMEKNMLVVLTREPGSTARRGENGGAMVNGSLEDNGHARQSEILMPSHDVEMAPWIRECNSATTITVQTVEMESAVDNMHNLSSNIIPSTELTVVKSNPASSESYVPPEKAEQDLCMSEMTAKHQDMSAKFTPSTSEIASIVNLTSQIQPQDLNSATGIQNLSNMVPETSNIVGDVAEAIMNEDTNSQPSLDMENNDVESFESSKKLQTTFHSSDFIVHGNKSQKSYSNDVQMDKETVAEPEPLRTESEPMGLSQKPTEDKKELSTVDSTVCSDDVKAESSSIATSDDSVAAAESIDKTIHTNASMDESVENIVNIQENIETLHRLAGEDGASSKECASSTEKNNELLRNTNEPALADTYEEKENSSCTRASTNKEEEKIESTLVPMDSELPPTSSEDIDLDIVPKVSVSQESETTVELKDSKMTTEDCKDIVSAIESVSEVCGEIDEKLDVSAEIMKEKKDISCTEVGSSTTTEEADIEGDTKGTNAIVPDPLPIIEQPKEEEPCQDLQQKPSIVDVTDETINESKNTIVSSVDEEQNDISESTETKENVPSIEGAGIVDAPSETPLVESSLAVTKESSSVADVLSSESMEVDEADNNRVFQQDEPMEEDVTELDKS